MAKHEHASAQSPTQGLVPLSEMRDLTVDDHNSDVRGWPLRGKDNVLLGRVVDLLVDRSAMKVRYLDVALDRNVFQVDRRALIPVGATRIDEKDDIVHVALTADDLRSYPDYQGRGVTREYETSLRSRFAGGAPATAAAAAATTDRDFYDNPNYDERGLFGARRARTGLVDQGEARMTLAEEQLAVGRRQVQAGEAYLRKTVETEHVQESVPVRREELRVERRPLSADASTEVQIGEDEIRIPLTREEIVVEKRAVPVEEIVIRKEVVTEQRVVEADLRRERLDDSAIGGDVTDSQAVRGGTSRAASHGGGLVDKIKDKIDDMKDRVDANPASRPGRDATDRPTR